MTKFRVKELAKERGLTSEQLAFKSGVRVGTVRSLWQNAVDNPSYKTLRAIAIALSVPIEELEDPNDDGAEEAAIERKRRRAARRRSGSGKIETDTKTPAASLY